MNFLLKRFISVLIFVFLSSGIKSQNDFFFTKIDNRSGISSDFIRDILEDKEGYIWFCTDDGLNRYDGYEFKIYSLNNESNVKLPTSTFTCIEEDNQGRIWLGTFFAGVCIYDKINNKVITINQNTDNPLHISNNRIQDLFLDNQNRMWIATDDGINRFDLNSNKITHFPQKNANEPVPSGICTKIYQTKSGTILIGNWHKGIYVYHQKTNSFTNHLLKSPIVHDKYIDRTSAIFEDSKGFIWVGTWEGGLFKTKFENNEFKVIKHFYYPEDNIISEDNPQYLIGKLIYEVLEKDNNIWVATSRGISIISTDDKGNEVFKNIKQGESSHHISNDDVCSMLIDRSETIWIGTAGGGINILESNANYFKTYTIPPINEYLSGNIITSMHYKNAQEIYIGVHGLGYGIYNLDKKNFTAWKDIPNHANVGPQMNAAYSFYRDSRGYLWIGTRYEGLLRLNEEKGEVLRVVGQEIYKSLTQFSVNSIIEDKNHNIWVGTSKGLIKLIHNKTNDSYNIIKVLHEKNNPYSLQAEKINRLFIDSENTLWVASEKGLAEMISDIESNSVFEFRNDNDTVKNGLKSNIINTITEDKLGRIWIGTGTKGLALYNKKTKNYKYFGEKNNISNSVYDIIEEKTNVLWLSTNKGLARFIYNENSDSYAQLFVYQDGLQGNRFNKRAAMKDPNGNVYFGGNYGFNMLSIKDLVQNNYKPPVVFTELKVNNKDVNFNEYKVNKIKLKNTENNIELKFSALSYSQPYKNKFAYILENFDKDWKYTDYTKRNVTYTNLPPGKYILKVKASNNSFIWSDKQAVMYIEIKPSPFKTWYAYLIYILIGAFILFQFYKIRMKSNLEIIKTREREKVNQFKLRFFTNITHEFLTPLSVIKCSIEDFIEKKEFDIKNLIAIDRNVNRLLRLVNQLLDFRKVETGNMKLNIALYNVERIFTDIWISYQPFAAKRGIKFVKKGEINKEIYFDADKIDKVLNNLISNAFKYTSDNSNIEFRYFLSLENKREWLNFSIMDSGPGIDPKYLENIFERFYQVKSVTGKKFGVGIGLALSKNLITLHKGEIKVENQKDGTGALFTVKIPVNKEAYNPDEISDEKMQDYIPMQGYEEDEISLKNSYVKTIEPIPTKEISVLIVEDNNDFRKVLSNYLSDFYNIYEAENGRIGYELAKAKQPEIIISDVMMPEMNGFEMTDKIKKDIEISHTQIILLTAKVHNEDRNKGYLAGADSYLPKPTNLKHLQTRIQSLIIQRNRFKEKYKQGIIPQTDSTEISETDRTFLNELIKKIEDNITNTELNVEFLSELMHISYSSFYRKTMKLTDMSPVEFIRHVRIQKATNLLMQGNKSISEIAYDVGFSEISYFSKVFKKKIGKSPSQFVKMHQK